LEEKQGIRYWRIPFFEAIGCRACFFLRQGGKSGGDFRSLNLGLNTSDAFETILRNRKKALNVSGMGPALPVVGQQVHHHTVTVVGPGQQGRGWFSVETAIPQTDGLMTAYKGLPLAITIADCVPILLADERQRCVAAVHAGWRGIEKKILPGAVRRMILKKQSHPGSIRAVIGPAIGSKRFEVQGEALEKLRKVNPDALYTNQNSRKTFFDLWKAAHDQLIASGLHRSKIKVIRECTYSHRSYYFSHRRDGGNTGRMLAMIQINP